MKESSASADFQGLHYYRSADDPQTFYFLSEQPTPQRDPRGRPALSLVASDQGALLQLGVNWGADNQQLLDLKQHLAAQFRLDPVLIRLAPAPLAIEQVVLAVGDGAGHFDELATSSSSGYGAYAAIFNVRLTTAQKERVVAALGGRQRFLTVTYRGQVTLAERSPVAIERSTDVGDWFASGAGLEHIQVVTATIGDVQPTAQSSGPSPSAPTQPSTPSFTVRIGFDTKDAPLAFIQVSCGEAQAVLRGASFDAVTLAGAPAGQPLIVKTSYTMSGPPFETTLPPASAAGWTLSPSDVGLAQVVADATARRAAGAREVRVRVRYRPADKGSDDERTVYLRRDEWMATWFLVTRSRTLGGVLEFEWKETAADGTAQFHSSATTDQPELKF